MLKRVSFAACLLLIPALVFGQAPQFLQLRSWNKGLNSHVSDYSVPEGQSSVLENVRVNKRFGSLAKRTPLLNYGTTGSAPVNGLHRYYKTDASKKLVAASGTGLYAGDDDSGTFTQIGQGLSDGKRWDFLTYKDVAIGANGVDPMIKYDGSVNDDGDNTGERSAGDLVTELGAPFANLKSGAGLDASSWYQYKIAFYDGANYSYSTARSNPLKTFDGGILDYSSHENTLTAEGDAETTATVKKFGSGSLALDGTGDYVTVPSDQKLTNGSSETWTAGDSSAPDGWTLSGAGAAIAKESTTIKVGTYSAKITSAVGAASTMQQNAYTALGTTAIRGKSVTFGCWVYATEASVARITINDAVGLTHSSYHTGVAGWEYLTVTRTIDASGTQVLCYVNVAAGKTAYFDGAFVVDESTANFNFGSGDFTIDTWVRFNDLTGVQSIFSHYLTHAKPLYFTFNKTAANKLQFIDQEGATALANYSTTSAISFATDTWYHLELVRSGTSVYIFVDGVSQTLTATTPISTNRLHNVDDVWEIGAWNGGNFLSGYLDEFRVSNGIARHTANFTVEDDEYASDSYTTLLMHNNAAVQQISLTDIPLGPKGTTQRIIYRTLGNATRAAVKADTTFYQVATLSDNTTTTYDDSIADGTVDDDAAPTWATVIADEIEVTPPVSKFITIHDGKLFAAGDPDAQSAVYWSDTFNPDYFYPTDNELIRPDDGDYITFIETYLGKLAVGKTKTIQRFYTDDTNSANWTISSPFSFVGCIAPYSVAVTPSGIAYLSWNGIYNFTGQQSQLISDAVTEDIKDIIPSRINEVAGYYFKNEYHLAYASQASGEQNNNRVLVYDFIRDAYVLDTKNVNSFAALDSGDDFGIMYLGSSLDDGKVYADEGSDSVLAKRFKSEIDAGTFDDTVSYGEEANPTLELGWTETIDEVVGTIDAQTGIIDRPDTDGTWESPVYEVNAASLLKFEWNEQLNTLGNVTWQVRSCSTNDCSASTYSSAFTDPTGSDLTALTADRYIQFRANLSTYDITVTPELFYQNGFVFRLFYVKSSGAGEGDFTSQWESGWLDFGNPGYEKFLKRIRVLYRGTEGTMTFAYKNDAGDVNRTFTVDLSKIGPEDADSDGYNEYTGVGDFKVYTHYPTENTETDPAPVGEHFKISMSETGDKEWEIAGVEVEYEAKNLGPM